MTVLVTGGSGSGKSAFAENIAARMHERAGGSLIYIATMAAYDEEAFKKIERHRKQRSGKGFRTIECFTGMSGLRVPKGCTVLLDCLSNLAANEQFSSGGAGKRTAEAVTAGIMKLIKQCKNLIMVTDEVFSDGCSYSPDTVLYIKNLAEIGRRTASLSDCVYEIICGIPVLIKGGNICF